MGKLALPHIEAHYRALVIKTVSLVELVSKPMELESPETDTHIYGNLINGNGTCRSVGKGQPSQHIVLGQIVIFTEKKKITHTHPNQF